MVRLSAPRQPVVLVAAAAGLAILVVAARMLPLGTWQGLAALIGVAAIVAILLFRDIRLWDFLALFCVVYFASYALPSEVRRLAFPVVGAAATLAILYSSRDVIRDGEVKVTGFGKFAVGVFGVCALLQWAVVATNIRTSIFAAPLWLVILLGVPVWLAFCLGLFWQRPFISKFGRIDRVLRPESLRRQDRYRPDYFAGNRQR